MEDPYLYNEQTGKKELKKNTPKTENPNEVPGMYDYKGGKNAVYSAKQISYQKEAEGKNFLYH